MNLALQVFCRPTENRRSLRQPLCLRISKCFCRANFASRGLSSMSSTRETPKKLVAVLEHKTSLCSDDHCRLCRCSFKVQKGGKFQHISTENLYKLPGKKGVEKRPLDKLLSEDLGLHLSNNPNYSSRVCAKCALKIRNAVELVRFLKANLNHVVANVKETSVECETQQRWKRMSKSPSSAEKPKAARIPTAESETHAPVEKRRGLRVKKSFSFQSNEPYCGDTTSLIEYCLGGTENHSILAFCNFF